MKDAIHSLKSQNLKIVFMRIILLGLLYTTPVNADTMTAQSLNIQPDQSCTSTSTFL